MTTYRFSLFFIICALFFSVPVLAHDIYNCKVTNVVDGDTFDCHLLIDPYFKLFMDVRIRLARVDCPEIRGETKVQGLKIAEIVRGKLLNKDVQLLKFENDKYGRTIAEVVVDQMYLSDWLLSQNYCVEYK